MTNSITTVGDINLKSYLDRIKIATSMEEVEQIQSELDFASTRYLAMYEGEEHKQKCFDYLAQIEKAVDEFLVNG